MQVTFLTQYYPPEMGAPPARISEFARGLAAKGWDVEVITALPNYPTGTIFPAYRGKRYLEEKLDGIPVKRTWIRPDASGRVVARLAAALSFAASALIACKKAKSRGGALIAESPPLTIAPAGILAARFLRSAYVLNISDLWPRSLVEMGVLNNQQIIRAAERMEALSYRATKLITAQSPDIVSNIKERFPECVVELLSNGVDTHLFSPNYRSASWRETQNIASNDHLVTFAGLHGFAQGLDTVVEVAHRLQKVPNLRFLFVGDGPAKSALIEQAERLCLKNVCFLPPVPRDQVVTLLASSDIAMITLARPLLGAIPSKVYEAMACGVPVVAATGGGADTIVREANAGLVAQPGNAEDIANTVMRLVENSDLRLKCGQAGRQLACEQYDRHMWVERLSAYLEQAIG